MLCEECGKVEAIALVVVKDGENSTHKHYCLTCLQQLHMGLAGNLPSDIFQPIMSLLSQSLSPVQLSAQENKEFASDPMVCPQCNRSYKDFLEAGARGTLGCPQCYQAFSEPLLPLLQEIHGATLLHNGQNPCQENWPQDSRSALLTQLERAVENEDYENAVLLRDALAMLPMEEENADV